MRLIAVTSPATDAGKTFLSAGISEALACRNFRTLFVELDVAVGDALRVFGLTEKAIKPHPTVATWKEYSDLAKACLKTPSGVCVLPRPEVMTQSADTDITDLIELAADSFDFIVADLGSNWYSETWAAIIKKTDTAFLISDCDEKALVRLQRFLNDSILCEPPHGWILAVNTREKKGFYRPEDVVRNLGNKDEITGVIRIPYFQNAEKLAVKTFNPASEFAGVISKNLTGENMVFQQLPQGKKMRTKLLNGIFKKNKRENFSHREAEITKETAPARREHMLPVAVPEKIPEQIQDKHRKPEAKAEIQNDISKGLLLLAGSQSEVLAEKMKKHGWKVTTDINAHANAAVVDMDILNSRSVTLPRPYIVYSNRVSAWLQPGFDGEFLVSNSDQIPLLLEPYADTNGEKAPISERSSTLQEKPENLWNANINKNNNNACAVYAFYSGAQGFQGKTVLAINAGVMLARKHKKVCIVDMDTDKAGLTYLMGYSETEPPETDLYSCIEAKEIRTVKGPSGVDILPASIFATPGCFPKSADLVWMIYTLSDSYDYVILDFGAKLASPAVLEALKMSDRVYVVSTPMRMSLSAIARFRGRELAKIGPEKITAVINRVGVRGGVTSQDAAMLLGFERYFEIPEDPAVVEAENDKSGGEAYYPPVLKKKNLIGPALEKVFGAEKERRKVISL